MAKNNKKCAVCGTSYRYCTDCNEFINYPVWMTTFCSEECLNAFEVMSSFESGHTDKESAKAVLMGYRESGKYKNYKKSFAATYAKIMDEASEEKEEVTEASDIPVEKEEEGIKQTEEMVVANLSQETASAVKDNMISEAKKTYPKAVAHKHGR